MTSNFLRGLGRFVGLIDQKKPFDPDPDRLGHLIVNEEHFAQAYQHLGRRQLRKIWKEYGLQTYTQVHPESLVNFLEVLMGVIPTTKSGEKMHLFLETVVRILVFQRDKQGKRFSLYRLVEQMSLPQLIMLYDDTTLPRNLREALGGYLDGLPGFRDARIFEERLPIACYTLHQIQLKGIQGVAYVLDKRALGWFKRELASVAEFLKQPGAQGDAHRQASHLINLNRTYCILDEEDLISQLILRGFKSDLFTLNNFKA